MTGTRSRLQAERFPLAFHLHLAPQEPMTTEVHVRRGAGLCSACRGSGVANLTDTNRRG